MATAPSITVTCSAQVLASMGCYTLDVIRGDARLLFGRTVPIHPHVLNPHQFCVDAAVSALPPFRKRTPLTFNVTGHPRLNTIALIKGDYTLNILPKEPDIEDFDIALHHAAQQKACVMINAFGGYKPEQTTWLALNYCGYQAGFPVPELLMKPGKPVLSPQWQDPADGRVEKIMRMIFRPDFSK